MGERPARNYDLDLLYIVVLGGVIVSHFLIPFSTPGHMPPYPIRNDVVFDTVWVIKPVPIKRFLFGLRLLAKHPEPVPAPAGSPAS